MTNPSPIDHANDRHTDGEPQHTPTPWCVDSMGTGIYQSISDVRPLTPNPFGSIAETRGIQREANAAFICRAVNCHDELVEALIRLLACPDLNLDDMDEATINDLRAARAALDKAKGGRV